MQLLLYTPQVTPRLEYVGRFIFEEIMSLDLMIVSDKEIFNNHTGPKLSYGDDEATADHLKLGSCGLLIETGICHQPVDCFTVNGYKAFFKTPQQDFPFDILAASFYLLSRYEEYLPHEKDMYGRYAHENSLAFKENFLQLPLINIWINDLIAVLQNKFTELSIQLPPFSFQPTYDIDMAYSYRYKGWLRNIGGFIKSPSIDRVKVLMGLTKDPFDAFDWLDQLHDEKQLQPLYFFLVPAKNGIYDKNILPHKKAMQRLVKQHAEKYQIGLHPSWQSGDAPTLLGKEKQILEGMCHRPVTLSRQHYIRFDLPHGYRRLIGQGIRDDHSMGYGSINGFRASVASSFDWFDLLKNEATGLRIHPFCFMDANSFYEQNYTAAEAYDELVAYYNNCKSVSGKLITIWHNNFLGTGTDFNGWAVMYQSFISKLTDKTSD